MKHFFDPTIIREYDIRGIYNSTLSEEDAKRIGHVFALTLKNNKIVNVACDGRHSSLPLKKSLIQGLVEGGANVRDIGLGPTPMLYFSCFENDCEAGIMITGSHNPPTHNGFKIVKDKVSFFGENLKKLSILAEDYELKKKGKLLKNFDISKIYLQNLVSRLNQKKELNIAWDAGNGSAGAVMEKLSKFVKGKNILLYSEINGDFPNHHPDPSDHSTLQDLINNVKEKKLDFGIAFDGDGDRIGVVDDKGSIIPGDLLLLLFAQEIIEKNDKTCIIGDVKCSQVLFDQVNRLGGRAVMSKTGHSLVKNTMKKESADLAGEMSGHIFFSDKYYGFDDALYAAVRLINLMSSTDKKLSEVVSKFPKLFNTPEIRIDCDDREKFELIKKIIKNQKGKKFSSIDGIRVSLKDGWWLLRASNTQAAIVLRCESNTEHGLKTMIDSAKYELSLINSKLAEQIIT